MGSEDTGISDLAVLYCTCSPASDPALCPPPPPPFREEQVHSPPCYRHIFWAGTDCKLRGALGSGAQVVPGRLTEREGQIGSGKDVRQGAGS